MPHTHSLIACAAVLVACVDVDGGRAPAFTTSTADSSPSPEPPVDGETETGETGDDPPDLPPEPLQGFGSLADVSVLVHPRKVTVTAYDSEGAPLGWVQLRHEGAKTLSVELSQGTHFAWVALDSESLAVSDHRATISAETITTQAGILGDYLQTLPPSDERACSMYLAAALRDCADTAETGAAVPDGCPASAHLAACECLAPYPLEYTCP